VRRSYEIPAETFEVNAVGTANLLECLRQLEKACTVIVITTDKVYENKEQGTLFNEDDRLGGYDPYSASKACTELVVSSFRNSFFNPANFDKHRKAIFAARAGNVIGGGDWSKDRIIPDIVRALSQNQAIPVRNPAAVRPWQHVLEPIAGYLLLGALSAGKPVDYSTAYNFGPLPGDHISVRELVEAAIGVWGSGDWKDTSQPDQLHEAGLLQLDIQKAIRELQWEPKLDSSKAVEWTINWYRQPRSNQVACTIGQIESYFGI
jgi:CDP-glucose 4,6-dehydratase